MAETLSEDIYDFLHPTKLKTSESPYVVVLGDLNEEPQSECLTNYLHAARDRGTSPHPLHYTDHEKKRVRLYNCAWRYIGERFPHTRGSSVSLETAGTYYSRKKKLWVTFDHIIGSGQSLANEFPYLKEQNVRVIHHPLLFGTDSRPEKFSWNRNTEAARGLSDHLPVTGTIQLSEGEE